MNTKIIIGAVVLVLIVASIYLYTRPKPTTITTSVDTAEISAVLGDEYTNLIQEELNNLSIEQTYFNNQTQDSIASDMSQFYYT